MLVGEETVVIRDTQGYPAESIKGNRFKEAMDCAPGVLTAVAYRATMLPNITTADRGLVMIRAMERQTADGKTELISGPGRVAKALGLEKDDIRKIQVIDPNPESKLLRME